MRSTLESNFKEAAEALSCNTIMSVPVSHPHTFPSHEMSSSSKSPDVLVCRIKPNEVIFIGLSCRFILVTRDREPTLLPLAGKS